MLTIGCSLKNSNDNNNCSRQFLVGETGLGQTEARQDSPETVTQQTEVTTGQTVARTGRGQAVCCHPLSGCRLSAVRISRPLRLPLTARLISDTFNGRAGRCRPQLEPSESQSDVRSEDEWRVGARYFKGRPWRSSFRLGSDIGSPEKALCWMVLVRFFRLALHGSYSSYDSIIYHNSKSDA